MLLHYGTIFSNYLLFLELRCSPWRPHEKYGHARDVSFKHPINIYLGMCD